MKNSQIITIMKSCSRRMIELNKSNSGGIHGNMALRIIAAQIRNKMRNIIRAEGLPMVVCGMDIGTAHVVCGAGFM